MKYFIIGLMLLVLVVFLILNFGVGGETNESNSTVEESTSVLGESTSGQEKEEQGEEGYKETTLIDTSGAKDCVSIGEHLVCEGQILVVE